MRESMSKWWIHLLLHDITCILLWRMETHENDWVNRLLDLGWQAAGGKRRLADAGPTIPKKIQLHSTFSDVVFTPQQCS